LTWKSGIAPTLPGEIIDIDIIDLVFDVAVDVVGATEIKINNVKLAFGGKEVVVSILYNTASTIFEKNYSPYDLNKDGIVDILDLSLALKYLNTHAGDTYWDEAKKVDYNGDNIIDLNDLYILLENYTIPYF